MAKEKGAGEKQMKQKNADEKQTKLLKELERLVAKFKNKKGEIPTNAPYLRTEAGKQILELVLTLGLSSKEAVRIIGRSHPIIEKARYFHQLKKDRPLHLSWTTERLALVQEYYEKSRTVESRESSASLRREMVAAANKLPGPRLTANGIRMKAREYEWGAWGKQETTAAKTDATVKKPEELKAVFRNQRAEREQVIQDTSSIPPEKLAIKSDTAAQETPGQSSALVAFWSRIDFGGEGYRRGLVRLAGHACQQKGAHFTILNGGLVNKSILAQKEAQCVKARMEELRKDGIWKALTPEERASAVADERRLFRTQVARAIAEDIPHIRKPDGELAKFYIITSKAYDGDIGAEIAQILSEIRDEDIVFWSHGTNVDLPVLVKYVNKTILPIVPHKAVWRSRYYSTTPQGLIQDIEKRSEEALPDIEAVGCLGGTVHRPAGESRRSWFVHPALHNLTETHSAENQVGIVFVRFKSGKANDFTIISKSFKGLLAKERKYIKKPNGLTPLQDKIFEVIRDGAKSIGVIEYHMRNGRSQISRETIKSAVEAMAASAKLTFDPASGLWDFDPKVLQRDISYPHIEDLATYCDEDNVVAFGCLHAGSTCTDYPFFINEVPKLILETKANLLIGAGDFTQGLVHGMLERGEIITGMNDTHQEIFAAHLVGEVMVKVFCERLKHFIKGNGDKTPLDTEKITRDLLIDFLWVAGNHDEWKKKHGSASLQTFKDTLVTYVSDGVQKAFESHSLAVSGLRQLVASKIVKDTMAKKINYTSPRTKLNYKAVHPHTARTETVSIWAERCLNKWRDAHVVLAANWHTAARVEHYDADKNRGQRLVLQCPTICTHTPFEDTKVKTTDFGVAFAKIRSRKQRIIEVEAGFLNTPTIDKDYDNLDFVNEGLVAKLGCKPIAE